MKKTIITCIIMTMMISGLNIQTKAKIDDEISEMTETPVEVFEIKNKEAKTKYEELLSKQPRKISSDGLICDSINEEKSQGFENLVSVVDENYELDEVYNIEDDNFRDVIYYDDTDQKYILLEDDKVNETTTITVDTQTYFLGIDETQSVYLSNELGNRINVIENSVDTQTVADDSLTFVQHTENYLNTKNRATQWLIYNGPVHSTNKILIKILSFVATVAGGYKYKADSPMGIILCIVGLVLQVADEHTVTIHYQIFEYYAHDCSYYIQQIKYYYSGYSESTGKFYDPILYENGTIKYDVKYMFTRNPYDTGISACVAY